MELKNQKGFTLIEVIVVAGIIAILAGVLVPMIFGQIDQSRISKAKADVKSIQTAVSMFRQDTGAWPNRVTGTDGATDSIQVLYSGGTVINDTNRDWNRASTAPLLDYFRSNTPAYPVPVAGTNAGGWKGPYLTSAESDPWGNAYLVGVKNFQLAEGTKPVWIISAGPDGVFQTGMNDEICFDGVTINPNTSATTIGDDICLRIK